MDIKSWDSFLKDINAHLELDGCSETSIRCVTNLLCVEIGSLMLLDREQKELYIKAAKGLSEDIIKDSKVKIGENVSGWVALNKKPLLIKDITGDGRFIKRNGKYHNSSLLSVPLVFKDDVLGVINVNNKATKEVFDENDLNMLWDMASHIALAIHRAFKYEEVKKMSQIKLDFVSVVSHELRSPLTTVREGINLILDRSVGEINQDQERFLCLSRNNVERVLRLVNELLDLARLESGRSISNRSFQDICSVVKIACQPLKIDADKKKIYMAMDIPKDAIEMWFDADQVTRVIVNLLNNAIKFTPENGRVNIGVKDLGKFVQVSVIDNGVGIAAEDIDKVFDKFYTVVKVKSSTINPALACKGGIKGTGLGLPIAKEIIELHKGRIWVDSKVGMGSRFFFTLPKDMRGG